MSEKPTSYWIGNVSHVRFPAPLELDNEMPRYGDQRETPRPPLPIEPKGRQP